MNDSSCHLIAKQYAILNCFGDTPMYLDHNLLTLEALVPFFHRWPAAAHSEFRLAEKDEWPFESWQMDVEEYPGSAVKYGFSCVDRSQLELMARALGTSRHFRDFVFKIGRWARLRFIYINGVLVQEWPDSPYSNISQEEWQ